MMLQNQENQEQASQTHYCADCKRSFTSGKALGGHMSSAHVQAKKDLDIKNNMEKEHTNCDQCQKEFSSRKALHGHMRSHPERDWRGMEQRLVAGGVRVGTSEIDSESYQGTKSGNLRGKCGRPAAVSCTNPGSGSSINSESTNEIMVDDLEKLRKMVEDFKRHKSQGPDFSDHHMETNETGGKALESSSRAESMKVKETKGDDQSRGKTQKKSKRSKEKSLMIREDDSAIKMVANFERQKYQGPDLSDHMKETKEPDEKSPEFSSEITNEPGEKALESGTNEVPDSRISAEKEIESKGVDQCRARAKKRSRKSKEKSLIIKEDDSAITVPVKEGKTKFTCRKCGMSFTSHQALGGHMASHEKMIIRIWNEIEHVHGYKQASETKKKKRVKNTDGVIDKVESGENTSSPVEENNKIVESQPVVEGCNSSANVTENTEIARKVLDFDLNEMPNEED